MLPAGECSARDGRGPFRTGDRTALEGILAQTRTYHGQTDMVVDYDHQSFAVFSGEKTVSAKAAGWVRQLEARDDGIWANIEWTKAAAEAIEAKEYRYLSPVIPHGKDGQVRMILSVALTNVPATHLEALSAATIIFDEPDRNPDMDQILAALGLAKGSGEDAVLSALNAMLAANTAMATALGLDKAAKPAEVQAALTAMIGQRGKLLEAAGLAATARPEDAIAALAALKAGTAPDPTRFVPIEQVTAMQADLKALKEGALDKEAEAAVTEAMRAGKVSPGMKNWAIAHFKADKKSFETFLEGSPALTTQQLTQRPAGNPSAVDLSNPSALAAAATVYQKKLADAGQTIDYASAVVAVKEGAK